MPSRGSHQGRARWSLHVQPILVGPKTQPAQVMRNIAAFQIAIRPPAYRKEAQSKGLGQWIHCPKKGRLSPCIDTMQSLACIGLHFPPLHNILPELWRLLEPLLSTS